MSYIPRYFLVISAFLALSCLSGHAQQTVGDVYRQGLELYNQQDFVGALEKFTLVLKHQPSHPYARSYAGKCKMAIDNGASRKNDLEGQLSQIRIPEINLKDAPIGDVLDYLSARALELSGGKTSVNFIYKGTSEQRQGDKVTLSVRDVPMTEAIRYIGQLTKTHFSYEEHAVVADPNYVAPTHPALENAAKAEVEAQSTDIFGKQTKSANNIFD